MKIAELKVGVTYHELTIIGFVRRPDPIKPHWTKLWCHCRCSCGTVLDVAATKIASEHTKGCGCLNKRTSRGHYNWKGIGSLSKTYWYTVTSNARSRKLNVEVTMEQAWELFRQQEGRCALTGVPIRFETDFQDRKKRGCTASLDRKSSSLGYILSNVQWVHKRINGMKSAMEDEEFIEWCSLVAKHSRKNRSKTG